MTTTHQQHAARLLHSLHRPGSPLVLPNAWDAASARIVADCGAAAVATTSAGVSWSLGAPDGDKLDRERALAVVARVCAAVTVPVTADIESGYAADPAGVARTVTAVLAAGAVGVNIEDAAPAGTSPLRPADEQCARIRAAREAADEAGVRLFVNARTDVFLRAVGDPADRLAETLRRAEAYRAAGADGIFVPGVGDAETVGALVAGIDGPVNVLAGPGALSVADLAGLGVARVSLGSALAEAAYGLVRRAATEALRSGSYDSLAGAIGYGELNALLA
ncbi:MULTISPECIES: isocitrate lyase/phosphoenolpyruvate mutase family protein [unclassified Micromonospora]|uniref:isocitrate lyase/PEP mutase family protein n=1 Tax=unclassified Micromonospora TaxID=2617518 RepID=UPI00332A34AE